MGYNNRGVTLAARRIMLAAGTGGVSSRQIFAELGPEAKDCNLHSLLRQAVAKGTVWRVQHDKQWRYFAAREHAVAYARLHGLEEPPMPAPKPMPSVQMSVSTPLPTGPAHMPGDPVITPKTRIVVAPPFTDRRFEVEQVGRHVDPTQCRPWAREVRA